jgi:hypothetical protein
VSDSLEKDHCRNALTETKEYTYRFFKVLSKIHRRDLVKSVMQLQKSLVLKNRIEADMIRIKRIDQSA